MMTFTIEELRRLEAEATPGEWSYKSKYVFAGKNCIALTDTDNAPDRRMEANAALIVAMRNALPELLRALEAARELADWCEFEVGADLDLTPGLSDLRKALPPHGGVDV